MPRERRPLRRSRHAAPDHESCCRQDQRDHDLQLRRRHPFADDPRRRADRFGDNQANYAVTGPNRLAQRSFEEASRLGGVQGGDAHPGRTAFSRVARPEQRRCSATNGDDERRGLLLGPGPRRAGADVELLGLAPGGSAAARRCSSACGSTRRETLADPVGNLELLRHAVEPPGEYVRHAESCRPGPRAMSARSRPHASRSRRG